MTVRLDGEEWARLGQELNKIDAALKTAGVDAKQLGHLGREAAIAGGKLATAHSEKSAVVRKRAFQPSPPLLVQPIENIGYRS